MLVDASYSSCSPSNLLASFFTIFPCCIRSSPADAKQNKCSSPADVNQAKTNAREYTTAKFKTLATTVRKSCQIWKSSRYADAADVKVQPKPRDYLLKIQQVCNFSLVSLSIYPRSRQGVERIGQGEGRWSLPPKTALERSELTEKFQFREPHTDAEATKTPLTKFLSPKKKNHSITYAQCSPSGCG